MGMSMKRGGLDTGLPHFKIRVREVQQAGIGHKFREHIKIFLHAKLESKLILTGSVTGISRIFGTNYPEISVSQLNPFRILSVNI